MMIHLGLSFIAACLLVGLFERVYAAVVKGPCAFRKFELAVLFWALIAGASFCAAGAARLPELLVMTPAALAHISKAKDSPRMIGCCELLKHLGAMARAWTRRVVR